MLGSSFEPSDQKIMSSKNSEIPPMREDLRSTRERPRALTRMFRKLEPELARLDFEAQEFVCQVCNAYERGGRPDTKEEYKTVRRWLTTIIRDLDRLRKQCLILKEIIDAVPADGIRLGSLPDEIREAHKPRLYYVPIPELVGWQGPIAYFQQNSLEDPGKTVADLGSALGRAEDFLGKEIETLRNKVPKIHSLQKVGPILSWAAGGFYYVLERLFRERAKLTVKDAHFLIIEIRRKLDGEKLAFNVDKGFCPAIAGQINRMRSGYKKECDRVLKARFNLPPKR
jgi:hypothetical protein